MSCIWIAVEMGKLVHHKAYIRGGILCQEVKVTGNGAEFQLSLHGILLVSRYRMLSYGVVLELLLTVDQSLI